MSTFAQRKEQSGWLEPSDMIEVSPASLWDPDDEEENARRKARATRTLESPQPPEVTSEPGWIDTPGEIEVPTSSLWTCEDLVETLAQVQALEDREALPCSTAITSGDAQQSISAHADLPEEAEILPANTSSMSVPEQQEEIVSVVSVADQTEGLPHEALVKSLALRQNPTPRTLVLDESAVLRNEASFATVALRQEIPRPRVLDESAVLPGEASFATVRLYQKPTRPYSQSNRFASNFSAKRLLPVLLIIAVCSAAIIFRQKFKTASDSVQSPSAGEVTTNPVVVQTEKAPLQTQAEGTSNSTEPVPVSSSPNQPGNAPLVTDTAAHDTVAVTPESSLQGVSSNETKRKVAVRKNVRSDNGESGVTAKDVPIPKSGRGDSPAQDASRARIEPVANSANEARKAEAESQPAVTGGGERPRRVTQPAETQSNPSGTGSSPQTKGSKPKVIQWP